MSRGLESLTAEHVDCLKYRRLTLSHTGTELIFLPVICQREVRKYKATTCVRAAGSLSACNLPPRPLLLTGEHGLTHCLPLPLLCLPI